MESSLFLSPDARITVREMDFYLNLVSLFGIIALGGFTWALSENRGHIPWRTIIGGLILELVLSFSILRLPLIRQIPGILSGVMEGFFIASDVGARFIFGATFVPLSHPPSTSHLGYTLAFQAIPSMIFFSGFLSLFHYFGIIGLWVGGLTKIVYRFMGISGAEAVSGFTTLFMGIEAVAVVKPFLPKMTRSEMCAILACGFGTVPYSILIVHAGFLRPYFPNITGHLISASLLAIPACFILAKIMIPEVAVPLTIDHIPSKFVLNHEPQVHDKTIGGTSVQRTNPLDAAVLGAWDGVKLSVSMVAMLVVLLGIVSIINQLFAGLGSAPAPIGSIFKFLTIQTVMGFILFPFTLATGIPFDETWQASVIMGKRFLETAVPAYHELGRAKAAGELSDRTVLILSYALSGFANLASVGLLVGSLTALAPSRRQEIIELGGKAFLIGTMATFLIACVVGVWDNGNPVIWGHR